MKIDRYSRTGKPRASLLALGVLILGGFSPARAGEVWEAWSSDTFTLGPRESFQFHVTYDQIQVRTWKLVVDGGDRNCDLSVLRVDGEALVYFKTDESRHEVLVPWGRGEETIVVVTNRQHAGTFVVTLLGPPRGQVHASYSYGVNRALEAFAAGRRLDAEEQCARALRKDPHDGVAKVLLAGFLRDRNFTSQAAGLVEEALAGDLPPDMRDLAEDLRAELARMRAPLPPAVREGMLRVEGQLAAGEGAEAQTSIQQLLQDHPDLENPAKSQLQVLHGQALDLMGRDFEAVDAFTQALQLSRNRADEAVIYYHMGRLFLKMDNLVQAQGALAIALQYGLPEGLDLQAREALRTIDRRLGESR